MRPNYKEKFDEIHTCGYPQRKHKRPVFSFLLQSKLTLSLIDRL